MTSASKRRDSDKAQYQRRVPEEVLRTARGRVYPILLPQVGAFAEEVVDVTIRPAISFSLRVTGQAAGKIRAGAVTAQLDALFAGVRAGPVDLAHMQIIGLAGEVYRLLFDSFKTEPGEPEHWEAWKAFTWAAIEGRVANPPSASWRDFMLDHHAAHGHFGVNRGPELLDAVERLTPGDNAKSLERRFGDLAMWVLARHGLEITANSRRKLLFHIGEASLLAGLRLKRAALGDYSPDKAEQQFPAVTPKASRSETSLTGLFEDWWREAKAAGRKPSTYESYRFTISNFVAFLKHDDAAQITPTNVVSFKDHRLSTPSRRTGRVPSPKTVKDSDLAALKTIFGWAVTNRKLSSNPATGLTIKLGKTPRLRSKGFTESEAIALLTAAYRYNSPNERLTTAAAKRWVPWLCAFTGARVGEMAQLRRQDVRRVEEGWAIHITPEAGTQKTNEARDVPLHPQLVTLGFPEFVECCGTGPLFLTPGRDGDVLGPLQGLKNRLAAFGRSVVSDPRVAPNHGWRHRFKTIGMEADIPPRILDAIQGQAARSVADTYGEVTLKTMMRAISKLPSLDLSKLNAEIEL